MYMSMLGLILKAWLQIMLLTTNPHCRSLCQRNIAKNSSGPIAKLIHKIRNCLSRTYCVPDTNLKI